MKKKDNNKIRLGVFVSVGIALFIAGIYFIGKKQQLFNKTFRVSGMFNDISGLQVGNNVRFAGINVGVVDNIDIVSDTAVRVDLVIDEKTRQFIKKDASATIGSDGLMGNKIVTITSGTSSKEAIKDNDVIATSVPATFDDILAKLKITSGNAATITDDLAAIIGNIRAGKGTIGKLFMDTVFAKNIDQSVINIKQGTGGFKQNMEAASHNILLRGYIKKKEKERKEKKEEKEEKKEEQQQESEQKK